MISDSQAMERLEALLKSKDQEMAHVAATGRSGTSFSRRFTMQNEIIGYVGALLGDGMGVERFGPTSRRALEDWHGNPIGQCALTSSWRIHSHLGSHMYQIYATVDGREYTGRGLGEGMSVRLRLKGGQNVRD